MTISSTTRKAGPFPGNGVTVALPFTFKVFTSTDVLAVKAVTATGVETTLTLGTDYTVSLNPNQNANPGGTLTLTAAHATGTTVTLASQVANTQGTDLTNAGGFYPAVINDALDRATIQIQQLAEKLSRVLTFGISSGASGTLPNPTPLGLLGWNSAGTALQNFAGVAGAAVSTFMANVVAAVDAAAAQTALGASVVGRAVFGAVDAAAARIALGAQVAGNYADAGANTNITKLTAITDYTGSLAFRSFLSGLTLSTAGSSATMSIAAGVAMDSTNTCLMQLAATSKTTSGWVGGSAVGGLDTGTIANNTGYHFYVILRPDTGVVDVVFSLSSTSPTLPTNYTQYRRIGWGKINGSGQWTKFIQSGDQFLWDSPPLDVNAATPGTAAVLYALSVPSGVRVIVDLNVASNASSSLLYLSCPDVADLAPSATVAPVSQVSNNLGIARVVTNTSSQIRIRSSVNAAHVVATLGWVDTRGRDL